MSDILIKGIEMPKNCRECFACKAELSPEKKVIYRCCFAKIDCPLIPVPPHGDLIDRHDLKCKEISIDYDEWDDTFNDGILFVTNLIDNAPTIIPAEESK